MLTGNRGSEFYSGQDLTKTLPPHVTISDVIFQEPKLENFLIPCCVSDYAFRFMLPLPIYPASGI